MLNEIQEELIFQIICKDVDFAGIYKNLGLSYKEIEEWYVDNEEFRKSFKNAMKVRCELLKKGVN